MKKHSDGVLKYSSLTKPVTVITAEVITHSELKQMDKRIEECIERNKIARQSGLEQCDNLIVS